MKTRRPWRRSAPAGGSGTTIAVGAAEGGQPADRGWVAGTQFPKSAGGSGHAHAQSRTHGGASLRHAGHTDSCTGASAPTSPGSPLSCTQYATTENLTKPPEVCRLGSPQEEELRVNAARFQRALIGQQIFAIQCILHNSRLLTLSSGTGPLHQEMRLNLYFGI